MTTTKRAAADVAEDVEFILSHDRHALAKDIAARLGYRHVSGLQTALTKAGRRDLLDQLADNAALAGFHVTRRPTEGTAP
jgi:hypothetical protein